MFSPASDPLIPRREFAHRLRRSLVAFLLLVGLTLGGGILGYHFLAELPWIDALLDASMILTGMGPVHALHSTGAKLFASAYAIFSGVIFLAACGFMLAPLLHLFMHRFHIDLQDADPNRGD